MSILSHNRRGRYGNSFPVAIQWRPEDLQTGDPKAFAQEVFRPRWPMLMSGGTGESTRHHRLILGEKKAAGMPTRKTYGTSFVGKCGCKRTAPAARRSQIHWRVFSGQECGHFIYRLNRRGTIPERGQSSVFVPPMISRTHAISRLILLSKFEAILADELSAVRTGAAISRISAFRQPRSLHDCSVVLRFAKRRHRVTDGIRRFRVGVNLRSPQQTLTISLISGRKDGQTWLFSGTVSHPA